MHTAFLCMNDVQTFLIPVRCMVPLHPGGQQRGQHVGLLAGDGQGWAVQVERPPGLLHGTDCDQERPTLADVLGQDDLNRDLLEGRRHAPFVQEGVHEGGTVSEELQVLGRQPAGDVEPAEWQPLQGSGATLGSIHVHHDLHRHLAQRTLRGVGGHDPPPHVLGLHEFLIDGRQDLLGELFPQEFVDVDEADPTDDALDGDPAGTLEALHQEVQELDLQLVAGGELGVPPFRGPGVVLAIPAGQKGLPQSGAGPDAGDRCALLDRSVLQGDGLLPLQGQQPVPVGDEVVDEPYVGYLQLLRQLIAVDDPPRTVGEGHGIPIHGAGHREACGDGEIVLALGRSHGKEGLNDGQKRRVIPVQVLGVVHPHSWKWASFDVRFAPTHLEQVEPAVGAPDISDEQEVGRRFHRRERLAHPQADYCGPPAEGPALAGARRRRRNDCRLPLQLDGLAAAHHWVMDDLRLFVADLLLGAWLCVDPLSLRLGRSCTAHCS
mmetsp:Transcript_104676/g.180472  ORF Transcript_104676/g.180472 Transcript_104676/m.180472 type:complete len:491 (-) Transcript_104676:14-1486(-)